MNVVELFSGIGAQAKALEKINKQFNILVTCDWDINAIIAYDFIHSSNHENLYLDYTNEQLNEELRKYNLSNNGKKPMNDTSKTRLSLEVKQKLLSSIKRTNNLVDITKVKGNDLPDDIDLLTYSFPCQDLSLAGNWHNNVGGINRDAGNRSYLLWQVERLLLERKECKKNMPRFLLMENVAAIMSPRHIDNFNEWCDILEKIGYINCKAILNANDFGVPQMRKRAYMLSVYVADLDNVLKNRIMAKLEILSSKDFCIKYPRNCFELSESLRCDYTNRVYLNEALESNPNITISRKEIYENNVHLSDKDVKIVPTITTKQDRHPNSGVIDFLQAPKGKMKFRYLTPRECFLLMGFEEKDFQVLMDCNFYSAHGRKFFSRDKLNRMAGNSICVNVLESIFELVYDLNELINRNEDD